MPLTTLQRVKDYAHILSDDSDEILATLISAVDQRIFTRLRRASLATTAITAEKHDHSGKSDRLQLREYPVASTPAVVVRIDGLALAAADFSIEDPAPGWLIHHPDGADPTDWPPGRQHIEVDYTHGFATIPEDLAEAATTQVVWQFNRTGHRGARLGSRSTESGEGATATWMVDAWAPEVLDQINRYRRPLV